MCTNKKAVDYCIIEGRPKQVENEVRQLLSEGWDINGQMFATSVDRNMIAVQCLVKYEVS